MGGTRRIATLLVGVALAACCPAAAAQTSPGDVSPPGANDWSCRPTAAHPNPVVLVHGTGATMAWNWPYLSPILKRHGYCVFALTYGRNPDVAPPFDELGGAIAMERSAAQLAEFVDRVLAATGAAEVDIVGHSQGSLMPSYYVKHLGGAAKVREYVGLTPLWSGTNFLGFASLAALGRPSGFTAAAERFVAEGGCPSCPQFLTGSEFIRKLNAGGGVAVPGVSYTAIMTRYDMLVVPYTSGRMPGARNIVLQDGCPLDLADHAAIAFDPITARHVLNALDPANARAPRCTLVPPGVGAPWLQP